MERYLTESLPPESDEPPQFWRRLARLAGATADQAISVAGPHSLDAMVALCRAGYVRVECARQATCACADDLSDVLIVDGADGDDALAERLQRTLRLMRDGAVLAIRLPSRRAQRAVYDRLAEAGLQVTGCAHADGGALAAFTVRRRQPLRLAS